jgi:hypothetical protein
LNELDRLEINYRGPCTKLDAFRASLTKWSASSIDSNMFLETFPDDGRTPYTTVTLTYIGCRGGAVPAPVEAQGGSLATVSADDGESELSVLYWSPHSQVSWISKTGTPQHTGTPSGAIVIKERRVSGHVPPIFRLQSLASYYLAIASAQGLSGPELSALQSSVNAQLARLDDAATPIRTAIKARFNATFPPDIENSEFHAQPLVPGRYWACRSVTSKVLKPF